MSACPSCGAELSTPLHCASCDTLLAGAGEASPFEIFGLEPAYGIDAKLLRRRFLTFSRQLHPDFYAGTGADARALAEENTAILNGAHEILSDDFRRADWLVHALGGPREEDERQMPHAFLMEVLEWNEAIETARESEPGSAQRANVKGLAAALGEERERIFREIATALTPLPDPAAKQLLGVRQKLNAVRYLDRSLHEIAELSLRPAHG